MSTLPEVLTVQRALPQISDRLTSSSSSLLAVHTRQCRARGDPTAIGLLPDAALRDGRAKTHGTIHPSGVHDASVFT